MAELVSDTSVADPSSGIAKIIKNPMFEELQSTLIDDLNMADSPFVTKTLGQIITPVDGSQCKRELFTDDTICGSTDFNSNLVPCIDIKPEGDIGSEADTKFDLVVEDATLQAEFLQLAPMHNEKVRELEQFYNTQCAAHLTARGDSLARLSESAASDPQKYEHESQRLTAHFDKQQEHLVMRVSQSLQLLKQTIPSTMPLASISRAAFAIASSEFCQETNNRQVNGKKSRMLAPEAVTLMKDWFDRHIDNPYPTEEEKLELAQKGRITLPQVKAWFANKRNRSLNTKPKRQKARLANELSSICQKLVHAKQVGGDYNGAKGYGIILQELSSMIDVQSQPTRSHYAIPNMHMAAVNQSPEPTHQGGSYHGMITHGQESPYPYYMNYSNVV